MINAKEIIRGLNKAHVRITWKDDLDPETTSFELLIIEVDASDNPAHPDNVGAFDVGLITPNDVNRLYQPDNTYCGRFHFTEEDYGYITDIQILQQFNTMEEIKAFLLEHIAPPVKRYRRVCEYFMQDHIVFGLRIESQTKNGIVSAMKDIIKRLEDSSGEELDSFHDYGVCTDPDFAVIDMCMTSCEGIDAIGAIVHDECIMV